MAYIGFHTLQGHYRLIRIFEFVPLSSLVAILLQLP
jgi:hypothetical protein